MVQQIQFTHAIQHTIYLLYNLNILIFMLFQRCGLPGEVNCRELPAEQLQERFGQQSRQEQGRARRRRTPLQGKCRDIYFLH